MNTTTSIKKTVLSIEPDPTDENVDLKMLIAASLVAQWFKALQCYLCH
jgi:DNA-binding XRE family transcriptional regulator